MGYSTVEHLNEKFKEAYNDAIKAKDFGNLALAKQKFYEASRILKIIAENSSADQASVLNERAERLKNISDSIDLEKIKAKEMKAQKANQSYSSSNSESNELSEDELAGFVEFYSADELVEGFDGVIGLESAKEAVTEYVINPIKYADAYNYKFNNNKAILLEGPPGTGKTTFAKAVAKEINQPFALVNVANLVNAYIGETAKNIDKVFNALRAYVEKNNCGLTVFFDELDEIAKKRTSDDKTSASAVPALLRNMDGVKENKSFLILANTNCVELLDDGILDRFRKKIHIPLPDEAMRKTFFSMKLKEIEPEYVEQLNFDELALASEGLSGRQITYICDDFKYYLGGVKAGQKDGSDLNGVLVKIITNAAHSNIK